MASRLQAVTFDATDPGRVAEFWSRMLDRDMVDTNVGTLLPGDDPQLGLRFAHRPSKKLGQNRLHLHLTSDSQAHQQATVLKALDLGAQHHDVGQLPEDTHVVLADPEGNEFCVMEPGNSYLEGCGFLGEVTCDGSREVGLFWREALAWPLVWDEGQETAIQSPLGGTKVSWGGEDLAPPSQTRQRFDLVATAGDLESEAERLSALGARRVPGPDGAEDVVTMTDLDGFEFRLLLPS